MPADIGVKYKPGQLYAVTAHDGRVTAYLLIMRMLHRYVVYHRMTLSRDGTVTCGRYSVLEGKMCRYFARLSLVSDVQTVSV